MTNKISELWVKDMPDSIKQDLNDLVRSIRDEWINSDFLDSIWINEC